MKFDEQHFVRRMFFLLFYSVLITTIICLALICPANNSTIPDVDCFRLAKEFVWDLIEQKFVEMNRIKNENVVFFFSGYPSYLSSPYHVNYQLKLLTSDQLQLHDILYNNPSLTYFLEVKTQSITNDFDSISFVL